MNPSFDSNVKSRDQIILFLNTKAVSAVSPVRLSGPETESLGHDEVSKWNIPGSNHKLSQSQRMMHFETLQPFLSGVSLSCLCVPLIQF